MTLAAYEKLGIYSNAQDIQISDREAEARALMSCASQLRMAIDDQGKDMKAYGDAIRRNHRLWIMFQVALSEPDNQLPRNLKVTLLNLGRYIDKVSFRAVQGYAPELLQSLIDINKAIAIGLSRKPPESQPAPGAVPVEQSAIASVMTSI